MNNTIVSPTNNNTQPRIEQLKQLAAVLFDTLPPAESAHMMEKLQRISAATEYRDASMVRLLESILKEYGITV